MRPVIPIEVTSTPEGTYEVGLPRTGVNWTVSPEDFQRMKEGRICIKCLEPQAEAFPKVCSLPGCGYPIRDRQTHDIGHEYQGHIEGGPQVNLDEEQNRLDEKHYRDFYWSPDHHILIPRGVTKD